MGELCTCKEKLKIPEDLECLDFSSERVFIKVYFGIEDDSLNDYCVDMRNIFGYKIFHTSYKTFKMMIKWFKNLYQIDDTISFVNDRTKETISIGSIDLDRFRCKVKLNDDKMPFFKSDIEKLIMVEQSISKLIADHRKRHSKT